MDTAFGPGVRVRLKSNPGRTGVLSGERIERQGKVRWQVLFPDGTDFVPELALECFSESTDNPFEAIRRCRFGKPRDLRVALTYFRLSGRLADVIYSLNTTNTDFYAYQFKPVLSFLESPSRGLLIADEVGLGKTIEAGLIWTELRSRDDARRLVVLCPAMLREKWRMELLDRFGIDAEICSAEDVLKRVEDNLAGRRPEFALIASLQGLRPPSGWREDDEEHSGSAARLARLLSEKATQEPLFDLVIVDEAHYLRNPETQTANLGRLVRPVTENLLFLSATPVQLRSRDLFQLLNLLDPDSFPFEWSFEEVLKQSAPVVRLRDRLLSGVMTPGDFQEALREARSASTLFRSEVLAGFEKSPPDTGDLKEPSSRVEIADRIDRTNPLVKVVSRTRKRDVQERRIIRRPAALRAPMADVERMFYDEVTERVRKYCERLDIAQGFMVTIPQRQMCSSMPAACRAWQRRTDDTELEEALWDAFGSEEGGSGPRIIAPLITELVKVARDLGDYETLRRVDSKFAVLNSNLQEYWKRYPDAKVVLFAYFRETLAYLSERLAELGISNAVLMGGMDKDVILKTFARPDGPRILLATEVASEGIDLQFSSLVVNYDLPWNPMRIEQRIGRIDRIGQQADAILIWNVFCKDTLDDRVYTRLLERLSIFEHALGSTEAILGSEIRAMSYELLSHDLSPEEEAGVIEQTRIAVEQDNRIQDQLEEQAIHLAAHGDYIQQKISLVRQLNRYITGRDLMFYVRDFLDTYYPGGRIIERDSETLLFEIELAAPARATFGDFLAGQRMQGRTRLADPGGGMRLCQFENRLQRPSPDREVISQYHPLVTFIARKLRESEKSRNAPVVAVEVSHLDAQLTEGTYVFAVQRWSFSGERDMERLAFEARLLGGEKALLPEAVEKLVYLAATFGENWFTVEHGERLEEAFHDCVELLDRRFEHFVHRMSEENRDRLGLQLEILQRQEKRRAAELEERIARLQSENRMRVIPALQGQLRTMRARIAHRRASLEAKLGTTHDQRLVAGGVIRVR